MYTTAKGQIQPDGSYRYVCGACGFKDAECPYCFGKNMDRVMEAFTTARGQQYYSLLKTILHMIGKDIIDEAKDIIYETDTLTPKDWIYLCIKFGFPKNRVKPLAEWLEEGHICPYGIYAEGQRRGFQPSKVWDHVLETHPRLIASD